MSAEAVGARGAPPIRVSLTDSAGRGVFATRVIGSGELIHTAKPLVTHPSLALPDRVCYYCLKKLNRDDLSSSFSSLKGEGDSSYCFCGEECRDISKACYEVESKADWSLIHDHCRIKLPTFLLNAYRQLSSASFAPSSLSFHWTVILRGGTASANGLDILQPATLLPGTVSQMEEEFELLKWTLLEAKVDEKLTGFLTKHWYMGILARIRINAFRIELVAASYEDILASAAASVAAQAAVGSAVYMLPSLYNHDCDPNTHIVWIDSAFAKLKALRHIEEGEELRICYLDASMDFDARQKVLSEGFGFQCRCLRCLSND
ncbi:histone-lysine N-methyltransferase ATXR4 isoform X1 [Phalaenopsis equestris]|uniref:histone-lysine N-methyltransferase ATXR4 isoform X1 n=1 Tax=Phalaenopsis equestris TaxID=78828 RepID=UPI0009E48FD1|nr:histone-lysine N-methyltransferase ATXR4 isoform X1 [Phalaenopsis equestris]